MRESDAGYGYLAQQSQLATGLSSEDYFWKQEAPGETWPVIVATPGSLDRVTFDGGKHDAFQRQEWNVIAIDKGHNDTRCGQIAEQIYDRLRFRINELTPTHDCLVVTCLAGAELDYTDRDSDGTVYRHRGNLYTLWVRRNT